MLTAHVIVKNEENFIWFSLMSVLDCVDKILIFDTGSTDKTVSIIKTIGSPKIRLELKGTVSAEQLVELRNEQIRKTRTPWFLLLDGDEVWPRDSIASLKQRLGKLGEERIGVAVRNFVCVGDIYHRLPEKYGQYELLGQKGHLNIRAFRKESGYHWQGVYPLEVYCDKKGRAINEQNEKLYFVDKYYWHLSFLKRSAKDTHRKHKYFLGEKIPDDYLLPRVFFLDHPSIVPSPFKQMDIRDWFLSVLYTSIHQAWLYFREYFFR